MPSQGENRPTEGPASSGPQAGSAAEALYRSLCYSCLGELPDYAAAPDGYYNPTVIYYKRLFVVNLPSRAIAS